MERHHGLAQFLLLGVDTREGATDRSRCARCKPELLHLVAEAMERHHGLAQSLLLGIDVREDVTDP